MEGRLRLRVGETGERADLLGRVQVVVPRRVAPGRVGPDVGDVHEKRPVGVPAQPLDGFIGHEHRLGQLGRELGGRPGGTVVTRPWVRSVWLVEG